MSKQVFPLSRKEAEKKGVLYSPDENKNTLFPSLLRELRKERGISQDEFAKGIQVTKSTVSLYEQGDNVPDIKTFVRIAEFYNVSHDYLLGSSDCKKRENADITEKTRLSEEAVEVLQASHDQNIADFLSRLITYPHLPWIVSEYHEYNEIVNNPDDYFAREEMYVRATGEIKNAVAYSISGKSDTERFTLFKCQNEFCRFVEHSVRDGGGGINAKK